MVRDQRLYTRPTDAPRCTGALDKIKVVHCGLPEGAFADSPPPLPPDPVFLCIGRLSAQKGHGVLLDAFATLWKTRPKARLVLAGDGELRADIEARIADLGIGHAVRITGWISSTQVREELLACRILVQPSLMEGLPVVIMEAMAQHRAVISTYVAGIPELVRPGQSGWLVPAGAVAELTEAMAAALATPDDQLATIGQAGFERVWRPASHRHRSGEAGSPDPRRGFVISILIPANNEEGYIGTCLDALLAQDTARAAEVIVSANACKDRTVEIARGYAERFAQKGWRLEVLDIAEGGKPNALNRADAAATGGMRVYLDADVVMSPPLLEQLAQAAHPEGCRLCQRPTDRRAREKLGHPRLWPDLDPAAVYDPWRAGRGAVRRQSGGARPLGGLSGNHLGRHFRAAAICTRGTDRGGGGL